MKGLDGAGIEQVHSEPTIISLIIDPNTPKTTSTLLIPKIHVMDTLDELIVFKGEKMLASSCTYTKML